MIRGASAPRSKNMQIVIEAKVMYHDRLGKLTKGTTVDVPDGLASDWLRRGFAVRYETKVMQERPSLADGGTLSASPAAQVSQQQTLSESSIGAKKRGRPKKEP